MSINLIYRTEKNGSVSGFVIVNNPDESFNVAPIGSCEPSSSFKQAFLITGEEGNRSLQTFLM